MKILKQGKLKNESFVGECNACGCIVEVHKSELDEYNPGDYRSDYEDFGFFRCPTEGCVYNMTCHSVDSKSGRRVLKSV
jgi:hypothetical protein